MFTTEFEILGDAYSGNDLSYFVFLSDDFLPCLSESHREAWESADDLDVFIDLARNFDEFDQDLRLYCDACACVIGNCREDIQAAYPFDDLVNLIYNNIVLS